MYVAYACIGGYNSYTVAVSACVRVYVVVVDYS